MWNARKSWLLNFRVGEDAINISSSGFGIIDFVKNSADFG